MELFSRKLFLNYKKHKKEILGALAAVLLAGIVFFFSYFHVTSVEVVGTTYYSAEEVKTMALQGMFTDNSVLAVLLHGKIDVEDVPFIEGFNITRLNHNIICVSVREKKVVGCIPYLDNYVYFDRNGIFVESSRTRDESVPFFDGLQVDHLVLNEKLPIKGNTILTTAVTLATIFQKNQTVPDHITVDSSYQITLIYGDVTVMLGKDEYLEDKMNRVLAILPKLSGQKGILHMENVTENSKIITFEKDTPEEGDTTASQTDVTDAYESALANWHGGYDGQGDYTGEGQYDANGNYVGPQPTEESIAALGNWNGGYMEDGSFTGYGQLDKDGNYVGPNPNETSDDGWEEESYE